MREFHPHLVTIVPEEMFDVYIDSALVGMRKPEPRIFELTLQELGVADPREVVFLDDFMGNIEGARAAGMQVIHVGDPRVALDELEAMLNA
jgi:putative hydrolase of the HAD superfamily